jgi:hypothetical protein
MTTTVYFYGPGTTYTLYGPSDSLFAGIEVVLQMGANSIPRGLGPDVVSPSRRGRSRAWRSWSTPTVRLSKLRPSGSQKNW